MVIDDKVFKKHTNNKFLIIDALISVITKGDMLVNNTSYYYHNDELQEFIISLYLLKLLINDTEYLEKKRSDYLDIVKGRLSYGSNIKNLTISNITNIEAVDEISLVLEIKNENISLKKENQILKEKVKKLESYIPYLEEFKKKNKQINSKENPICHHP